MLSTLIVLLFVMTVTAAFLGKELLKKFKIHEKFIEKEGYLQKIRYQWKGAEKKMRTFVLSAENPFNVLVGFKLKIPILKYESIDWFGSGESKGKEEKKTSNNHLYLYRRKTNRIYFSSLF